MTSRACSLGLAAAPLLALLTSCTSASRPPAAPVALQRADVRSFTLALNDIATVSGLGASDPEVIMQGFESRVPQALRSTLQDSGFRLVDGNADVVATVRVTEISNVDWRHNDWTAGATLVLTSRADDRVIAATNMYTSARVELVPILVASSLADGLVHSPELLAFAQAQERKMNADTLPARNVP